MTCNNKELRILSCENSASDILKIIMNHWNIWVVETLSAAERCRVQTIRTNDIHNITHCLECGRKICKHKSIEKIEKIYDISARSFTHRFIHVIKQRGKII